MKVLLLRQELLTLDSSFTANINHNELYFIICERKLSLFNLYTYTLVIYIFELEYISTIVQWIIRFHASDLHNVN